ncbi:MAG: branched-chain amino acid ABC transporter permease [Gammaproteobacteria bacterium]
MSRRATGKVVALHLAIIAVLFCAQFVLPAYHHTNLARIMVLATFAMAYNVLFGYTGLMSLGHAMFFAAGMYGTGLSVYYLEFTALSGFFIGVGAAMMWAIVFASFALRTSGVSFLIVTMMFGQAAYLLILYFNKVTLGDQGFTLSSTINSIDLFGASFPLADANVKFNVAWIVFTACFAISILLITSPIGRALIAIRENEERTRLLGYNTYLNKMLALAISGAMAGAAGATYALLFSYVGASFAAILYSIYPLLWTLLGGAGTIIGPLLGTGLMFYLVDITSSYTSAYLFVVGGSLLLLVLYFPQGIMGTLRDRWLKWLP